MLRLCIKVLILLGISVFLVHSLLKVQRQDEISYYELEKKSQAKEKHQLHSQQFREAVSKNIWIQKQDRLGCKIESAKSWLAFFPEEEKMHVIEEMEEVCCLFQEQLIFQDGDPSKPMQEIHYLKAQKATHNYTSNLFTAQNVHLWKYCLPGHTLPEHIGKETPLMQGIAEEVVLSLHQGEIQMQLSNLKAIFDTNLEDL